MTKLRLVQGAARRRRKLPVDTLSLVMPAILIVVSVLLSLVIANAVGWL
jgi:hypothetical protein